MVVPLLAIYIGSQYKMYSVGYLLAAFSIVYKIIVVGSLGIGAWGKVGNCYIPSTYKTIIMVTNCLEIMCLIV